MWLAVDIGGTKLAVATMTTDGALVHCARRPTPATSDPEVIFVALTELVGEVAQTEDRLDGIGIGCGGPMDVSAGTVSPLNIQAWRDFPLLPRLSAIWPKVPVVLRNDAVAMAIAEHWLGAGKGSRAMLGVVVSTGVGGGIVVSHGVKPFVMAGPTGNAGHVGHVVADANGPACGCGGRGCVEAIARGPAAVEWAVSQGWRPSRADGPALVRDARAGNPVTLAALTRAGRALGLGFAAAAHLLDLDLIVVGGGFANAAGDLLLGPARVAFERHAVARFAARCRIAPAGLGVDAGLVGAGALVANEAYQ